MKGRKTLDMWIREALSDPDKDAKCSMISLVHMVGSQEKEIHTTKFSPGKAWDEKELADMFRSKANGYAQDLPGIQTFQLLAFYGDKTVPQAFQPFTVNPGEQNAHLGLGTEAPTETGKIQQMMRWNDQLLSQVYRRQAVLDEHSMRIIDRLATHNERLTHENQDAYTIVKEMLMEKALNEHNRKMELAKFERETGERRKWLSFAPVLVNTVLGREIFPQSTADTVLIETLADSVTEDEIKMLSQFLKPEIAGPLAARMDAYMEKKLKEQAAIKSIAALKSPDPEADAAGDVVAMSVNGKS